MVKYPDGRIEGIPKYCKCGEKYSIVTLELSHSWGRSDMEGACVHVELRCLKCHPVKPHEWRDKDWIHKVHVDITTIDADAVAEAIQFFKELNSKQPHMIALVTEEDLSRFR